MVESLQAKPQAGGTDYAGVFARLEAQRSGREPRWLAERRRAAMDHFSEIGFPTSRLEDWRYTNVGAIKRASFEHRSRAGDDCKEPLPADSLVLGDAIRLVFVNGCFVPEASTQSLPEGLHVACLTETLAQAPERLEPSLAAQPTHGVQPFVSLNTALFEDGAFVHVARGVELDRPIHISHVATLDSPSRVTHVRNLIQLEESSRATVIESYTCCGDPEASNGARPSFTNAVTEVEQAAGSHLEHAKLQEECDGAYHLSTDKVRVARDAEFRSCLISLGAGLARHMLEVAFTGQGASCSLQGLYVVRDQQHADCQTFVDHALPHCTSEQNYRGILTGDSRGVFQGGVLVRPDAQKSNATQSNRNLLLSDRAKADSKPQLEIHADDVKCAHGATIGQLDKSAIFFLRSRGIDEEAARAMLTGAFAGEIADAIGFEPLLDHVNRAIETKLALAGTGLQPRGLGA